MESEAIGPSGSGERDAILLHAMYAAMAGLVLWVAPTPKGPALLALVLLYSTAFLAIAFRRGHQAWLQLAALTMPLSALQVMPDWFLSQGLRILVFPDNGVPMIGTVPVFMAAMWTIPLNLSVLGGEAVRSRSGMAAGTLAAAAIALVLFAGSEELVWRIPIWYARQVRMVGHTAVYIVAPEVILGAGAFLAWQWTRQRSFPMKLLAALALMLAYAGAAALGWLLIDT